MKGLLIGTALATLLGGTALAADYGQPVNPFVPQVPVYSWTGAYLGLQGGYGWGDSEYDFSFEDPLGQFEPFAGALNLEPNGFVGGGHLGALFQWNWLVIGAEGDIEFNTMDDAAAVDFVDAFGNVVASAQASTSYNWSASARGRVGLAFDRVLVYGTGGYAYSDVDLNFRGRVFDGAGATIGTFLASSDEGLSGWTAGGGVDALVGYNMSARIEYRYTDLEDLSFAVADDTLTIENNFHAVRAGLSYHF